MKGLPICDHMAWDASSAFIRAALAGMGETPPTQTCEMLSFASAEQMLVESNSVRMLTYSAERLQNLRPDLASLDIVLPNPTAPIGITRLAADDAERAAETAFFQRTAHGLIATRAAQ